MLNGNLDNPIRDKEMELIWMHFWRAMSRMNRIEDRFAGADIRIDMKDPIRQSVIHSIVHMLDMLGIMQRCVAQHVEMLIHIVSSNQWACINRDERCDETAPPTLADDVGDIPRQNHAETDVR